MNSRILFVGELEELKTSLDRMECQWDMVFTQNGPDALETLSATDFDVVVADTDIPGTDSSVLLNDISERHPDILGDELADLGHGFSASRSHLFHNVKVKRRRARQGLHLGEAGGEGFVHHDAPQRESSGYLRFQKFRIARLPQALMCGCYGLRQVPVFSQKHHANRLRMLFTDIV